MASIHTADGLIIMATDHLIYRVGMDGFNRGFQDQKTGIDYLTGGASKPFMSITDKHNVPFDSTAVELVHGFLHVRFGDSGITARIHVRVLPAYLTLELTAVDDHSLASFQLASLPLTLTKYVSTQLACCRNDDYAAAVIPLNIETASHATNGTPALLNAWADGRVRLEEAKIALVGCPTGQLLNIIEQVEIEHGLPHPTLGGVWARKSPEQQKSYLFVDLSEKTTPAMIEYAQAGAFGYIVVYSGVWNATNGTYPVNTANFHNGEQGLKAVSAQIHAAGLKFGMHNLDMLVSKDDALVSPIPAPGFKMLPDRRRILAAPIGKDDLFIPTTTSPIGLLPKGADSQIYGRDLRIGDEIVTYTDLQTTAPYGFSGCTRGAYKTGPVAHEVGAVIDNFAEFIGYYIPDVQGELYDRVARAEAAALDRFQFDYLYPDTIGENLQAWSPSLQWYIGNLLVARLYHYTWREVMFAHAPISDYSWHIFSRGNTTDYVCRGIIGHFDVRSLPAAEHPADLLPFEFGWFGYFAWGPDRDATRPREIEYAWSKALAYGAAMSLETTKIDLDNNGRTKEIFAIIKQWEELKLTNYFPGRIREQLKKRRQEFVLERTAKGKWRVLPVNYGLESYVAPNNSWVHHNPHQAQPLRLTLAARPTLGSYADGAVLLDPSAPLMLNIGGGGPFYSPHRTYPSALVFDLAASTETSPDGGQSFAVTFANTSTLVSWGSAEVILGKETDLTQHRALGVHVKGDNSGAYLHFMIEDNQLLARDYYVQLNFSGWRYVQMAEAAKSEVYDFGLNPDNLYLAIRNINYTRIGRVYVLLTNVAPGVSVNAHFGCLKALQESNLAMNNPGLTVNSHSITFPVKLQAEWYLEYNGVSTARVFDKNGFTQAEVAPIGKIPTIEAGDNTIGFFCDTGAGLGQTAKVNLITRGKPLR